MHLVPRRRAGVLAVVVVAIACSGCGGTTRSHAAPGRDREWAANAGNLIDQLRGDVVLTWNAGDTLPAARRALGNDSDLYALVLAYTDFGGCGTMVSGLGSPSARLVPVKTALATACGHLQRASALFTRSTRDTDPRSLLAASRQALDASSLLYTARFRLAAARV
jgi:hypothetical protein